MNDPQVQRAQLEERPQGIDETVVIAFLRDAGAITSFD
jgi:hypothetical protein